MGLTAWKLMYVKWHNLLNELKYENDMKRVAWLCKTIKKAHKLVILIWIV